MAAASMLALLTACGGGGGASNGGGSRGPTGSAKLTIDLNQAAPQVGSRLVFHAILIGADGNEIKDPKINWSSSDESVVKKVADGVFEAVGAGSAVITGAVTIDGTEITGSATINVSPATEAKKTYTASISPTNFTLAPGVPQQATLVVLRSDGANGAADVTNLTWSSDNPMAFVATPAADGRSAMIGAQVGVGATATGSVTACADTPAGDRVCANAALAIAAAPLPSISFSQPSLQVKPGRDGTVSVTLTDPAGGSGQASQATLAWTIDSGATGATISGAANGSQVVVVGDSANLTPYSGHLTVTATYPDGRSNSATMPLTSSGAWSSLPKAPPVGGMGPSMPYKALAVDATRAWTVSAGASMTTRVDLFGDKPGLDPLTTASAPGQTSGLWTVEGDSASLVLQTNASGTFQDPVAVTAADLSTLTPSSAMNTAFTDGSCATSVARRAYIKLATGKIAGAGWCSPGSDASQSFWVTYDGIKKPQSFAPMTGTAADKILAARVLGDGTYAVVNGNGVVTGNAMDPVAMPTGYMALPGALAAGIAPAASANVAQLLAATAIPGSALDGSVGSAGVWSNYLSTAAFTSAPEIHASADFVLVRDGNAISVGPNAPGGATAALPIASTGLTVKSVSLATATVGGVKKARVGVLMTDGSAWIYDQP